MTNNNQFDLEERTLLYGNKIIRFSKNIPKSVVTLPLISQVVRSGTSIGANYIEANEALSKKDFVNRIRISRKEAKETRFWLMQIIEANQNLESECLTLASEAREYVLIFSKIIKGSTGSTRFA